MAKHAMYGFNYRNDSYISPTSYSVSIFENLSEWSFAINLVFNTNLLVLVAKLFHHNVDRSIFKKKH